MAKMVDPDGLVRSSTLANLGTDGNVFLDVVNKKIDLAPHGLLKGTAPSSTSGVTLQCLYSFCKEEWKDDAALFMIDFPMQPITDEQFELIKGWDFANIRTKNLIRDGGWSLNSNGTSVEEYINVTTLGSFDDSSKDQAYILQKAGGTPSNLALTGEVNQAVKVYGDASHGNFDYRTYFVIYLREQGKRYGIYNLLVEQNISKLTYKKYAMPLSNGVDTKIKNSDANIAAKTPYTGMSIKYYDTDDGGPQKRSIGGTEYSFSIIINGNNATAEEIYEFVQYSLRLSTDIDADSDVLKGNTADELLEFVGDTLKTKHTTLGGVYIDNFNVADTNRIVFRDNTGAERTFPFIAAGTIAFNDNLQNSSDAIYSMFFTNDDAGANAGKDYGTTNAIIVKDQKANDIAGSISGKASISFDYDYDGNVQRGNGSAGTDVPITLVAIGTDNAQFVSAQGTILKSTTNNFALVANLERNYSNA